MIALLNLVEMLEGQLARLADLVRVDVVNAARVVGEDDDAVVVNLGSGGR